MPRYKYQCAECDNIVTVFHGINETLLDCEECTQKQTMNKLLATPIIIKGKNKSEDKKIGDLTRQYIEENRKILEEQKKELKKEDHEPA